MTENREILVGTDGSPDGDAAVEWACDEAAIRGLGLMICHVSNPLEADFWITTESIREELAALCQPLVDHSLELAHRRHPEVLVRGKVLVGSPTRILVKLAESAELTVLGRSGQIALVPRWLGSVVERVLALSSTPSISVLAPDSHVQNDVQRVVVGLSQNMPAESALDFGLDLAARHQVGVRLLHIIELDGPRRSSGELQEAASERLEKLLAARQTNVSDVEVVSMQSVGSPGEVLAETVEPGDLLVLGRGAHPRLIPGRLGRTTSTALHLAPCPVATVP